MDIFLLIAWQALKPIIVDCLQCKVDKHG